ncbi:L,D-transpeptidase family protein [Rhodoflexus sp.]
MRRLALFSILLFGGFLISCEEQSAADRITVETSLMINSAETPPTSLQIANYSQSLRELLARDSSIDSVISAFYRQRNFLPLWQSPEKIDAAVATLLNADEHGLLAGDYQINEALELKRLALRSEYQHPQTLAKLELQLTASLLQYAVDLLAGKLKPKSVHTLWNYPARDFVAQNKAEILQKYIAADTIAPTFRHMRQHPHYVFLKNQLATYRQMAAAGAFQPVHCDTTIKKGSTHEAITALRKRLRAEGLYTPSTDTIWLDDSLSEALKIWQYRHGLKQTGNLDTMTRNALNVPAEQRIATIRANMERMRWLSDTMPANYTLVNVADFRLFVFRNGKAIWETPVIVGAKATPTPIFETYMTYLELNPTWNLPHSIITKEVAVEAARRSDYISRNRFKILNNKGEAVDPSTINWNDVRNNKTQYRVYQPPGPDNQLGKIKFFCVNPHAIYLHDTPSQSKFKFQDRAFSHGCVRVWNPFGLAGLLMGDTLQWNKAAFDQLLAPGTTRNLMLPTREPVHLHYFTAFPDRKQQLILRRDIYGHDRRLLQMLDAPADRLQ